MSRPKSPPDTSDRSREGSARLLRLPADVRPWSAQASSAADVAAGFPLRRLLAEAGRTLTTVGEIAAQLGAAAGGAIAWAALESGARRRRVHPPALPRPAAPDEAVPALGTLRGRPLTVVADDGVGLYAEESGNSDARLTVVFCHGFTLNQDCWHFQRAAFADQARLVFYDQRGHGRSGRGAPGTATIDQLGRDLYAVLEQVVPEGPVVLVGHSMGGMTIMALAEEHPELLGDRVVGVALLSTSAGRWTEVTLGLPTYGARALHHLAPAILRTLGRQWGILGHGRRTIGDLIRLLVRQYSFASEVPSPVVEFATRMIDATPFDVIAEFYPAFVAHDKFAVLPAFGAVETLVMVGQDDLVAPVDHSETIARAVPSAELVVLPDAGHSLMLERPREVNARLRELLARAMQAVATGGAARVADGEAGVA